MHARTILKDFLVENFAASTEDGLHEGIYSDVFDTLIHGDRLDEAYYNFLIWSLDQGVPVTMISTEVKRAAEVMSELNVDPRLIDSLQDKVGVYTSANDLPFEVIIDDSMVLEPAVIVINPGLYSFQKFLATSLYKNHGRSHQADLPHPPAP
jgi:hypothetical protein